MSGLKPVGKIDLNPKPKPAAAPKAAAPKAEAKATEDYSSMTVAQLKEMAKAKGITGISTMKKGDLITAIQNV